MKYLKGIDYCNIDKGLEFLKNHRLNHYPKDNEEIIFHVYWYGKITRKQILCIKSYLATQNLERTKLWVWLDEDTYHSEKENITTHKNILVKKYAPNYESENTPLQHKDYVNQTKYLKFRSDLARLIFLYKYGGLYYDLDMILLKDLMPILDLEFCYQWSVEPKGNNGILRLKKQSLICKYIMDKYILELKKRSFFLGFNIHIFNSSNNILCLPCVFFDPVWVLEDTKTTSKYSKLDRFDNFFKTTKEQVDIKNFFGGLIYAYHWHSRNDSVIEKDSYFELLETDVNKNI